MASGRSIEVLIKALKEDGFDCDVATLNNCSNGFLEKLKLRFRDGVTLADGIKGSHRSIIDRHDMAGVEKQDDEAVVSKRYEDYGHDQELVNATRHAVDTLSAVLAEEFLKEVA
jgi:hypothetical protein